MNSFQPSDKYKNYSLPTAKPSSHQPFYYQQKERTLQEQISHKLEKLTEFLEHLYPELSDKSNRNIKVTIKKNLETFTDDLDLMKGDFQKNPYTFNTDALKTNESCIAEMKDVCDALKTFVVKEDELKKFGKIKHILTELEHLIHPKLTNFEKSIEKARIESKQKIGTEKKESIRVKAQNKIKEKPLVKSKKKKAVSKKVKPAAKLLKQPKVKVDSKPLQKAKPTTKLLKAKSKSR